MAWEEKFAEFQARFEKIWHGNESLTPTSAHNSFPFARNLFRLAFINILFISSFFFSLYKVAIGTIYKLTGLSFKNAQSEKKIFIGFSLDIKSSQTNLTSC